MSKKSPSCWPWMDIRCFAQHDKIIFRQVLRVLLALSFVLVVTPQAAASEPPAFLPGIVLVGIDDTASSRLVVSLEQAASARLVGSLPALNLLQLQVTPGKELAALARLRQQPGVVFAELDYSLHTSAAPSPLPLTTPRLAPLALQPDDPEFWRQWGLSKINLPQAWDYTTGSPGILIAVIDSGIQLNHPDLVDKIWINSGETPANFLDDDGNGKADDLHGWHFYHQYTSSGFAPAENANVADDYGHGTHVAGIAGAATNNLTGIAGAAWASPILPVKVLDEYGNGWYSDIAAGILYAADNGAQVINLSLGGAAASETLCSAVQYARGKGALVVAASGNSNEPVFYPAACEGSLAMAATNPNDQRADFSNYGPQVDLSAPGVDIYSTWYRTNYFTKSGTSMAAPLVSGVAALLWARYPDLTVSQMEILLIHTAVDVETPGFDPYTGWGRLDAYAALLQMEQCAQFFGGQPAAPLCYPTHLPLVAAQLQKHPALRSRSEASRPYSVGFILPSAKDPCLRNQQKLLSEYNFCMMSSQQKLSMLGAMKPKLLARAQLVQDGPQNNYRSQDALYSACLAPNAQRRWCVANLLL